MKNKIWLKIRHYLFIMLLGPIIAIGLFIDEWLLDNSSLKVCIKKFYKIIETKK